MRKAWVLAIVGLAACTAVEPVAVIGQRGDVLTGTVTGALSGGTIEASNGRLSCRGRYNSRSIDDAVSFAVTCSDGRQGIGTAIRDSSLRAGRGTVRLSDGEQAQFMFGPDAAIIRPEVGQHGDPR